MASNMCDAPSPSPNLRRSSPRSVAAVTVMREPLTRRRARVRGGAQRRDLASFLCKQVAGRAAPPRAPCSVPSTGALRVSVGARGGRAVHPIPPPPTRCLVDLEEGDLEELLHDARDWCEGGAHPASACTSESISLLTVFHTFFLLCFVHTIAIIWS